MGVLKDNTEMDEHASKEPKPADFGPFEPRVAAVGAMFIARGRIDKAAEVFKNISTKDVSKPRRFITSWWDKFTRTLSLLPEKRGGRKPSMSKTVALTASKALKAGYLKGGQHHRCHSVGQAVRMSTRLGKIKEASGVSAKTMLKHMKAADSNLVKHKIDVKPMFTPMQKKTRLATARQLLLREDDLQHVIFIDAKHFFISAVDGVVYMDKADIDKVVTVKRLSRPIKLLYYAAVNSQTGLVHLEFCTGTKELDKINPKRPIYQVSCTISILPLKTGCEFHPTLRTHICQRSLNCSLNPVKPKSLIKEVQPQ
jgi:hypothetical protein